MHARRLVGRSSTAIGVLGAVLIGAGAAHAALPRCDGPGSTGDNAAYRGIRFTTAESFGVVAVSLAGSSAGSYSFDAWLRRSSGFTDPIEAGRTITISLPTAGSEHPYSTVLIDLASVAVAGPETFTLALESITGPGLLSFETHGIGSQAQCAGVDETEENDVATPTVRADPAGFQLLPVASLACPGPGTGGDLADSRGIRFTVSKPFGVIALSFSGTEGN